MVAATPYAAEARDFVWLANAKGSASFARGDSGGASAAFARALSVAEAAGLPPSSPSRTVAYIGLARAALLAGRAGQARRYGMRALGGGISRGDIGDVVGALRVLAASLEQSGERADAIETLRTAALIIEQVPIDDLDAETRATYLGTQHDVFEDLTDLLIADARAKGADAPLSTLRILHSSCSAKAGHPVRRGFPVQSLTPLEYWFTRRSLSSGRPKAGPVGG